MVCTASIPDEENVTLRTVPKRSRKQHVNRAYVFFIEHSTPCWGPVHVGRISALGGGRLMVVEAF